VGTKRSNRFKSGAHSIDDCRLSTGHDRTALPAARRNGAAFRAASRLPVRQPRLASIGEDAGTARKPISRPRGPRREGFSQRSRVEVRGHVAAVARCDRALPGANRQGGFAGSRDTSGQLAASRAGSGLGHDQDREIHSTSWCPPPRSGLSLVGRAKSPCRSSPCRPASSEPQCGAHSAPLRSRRNGQGRTVVLRIARPGSFFTTKGIE
jgi:hypothetical protein